jgi:hypothetical protein
MLPLTEESLAKVDQELKKYGGMRRSWGREGTIRVSELAGWRLLCDKFLKRDARRSSSEIAALLGISRTRVAKYIAVCLRFPIERRELAYKAGAAFDTLLFLSYRSSTNTKLLEEFFEECEHCVRDGRALPEKFTYKRLRVAAGQLEPPPQPAQHPKHGGLTAPKRSYFPQANSVGRPEQLILVRNVPQAAVSIIDFFGSETQSLVEYLFEDLDVSTLESIREFLVGVIERKGS